jgi:hypothetical protein
MVRRLVAVALAVLLSPAGAGAQQAVAPVPLYPGAMPREIEQAPLPAAPPVSGPVPDAGGAPYLPSPAVLPPPTSPVVAPAPAASDNGSRAVTPAAAREFCNQTVPVRLADRDRVAEPYRRFVGIFSDAAWTPQSCAALVVENVTPSGTATITYAFGPMGTDAPGPAGVLHGTGIIRGGELKFQNADGSQFVFRPLYADLDGRLTTPQGQSYAAVFKRTP